MSAELRLGIDLGGTKIEIIALSDDGESRLRQRCATPAGDYAATLAAIADLVSRAEQKLGVRGSVGVGMPGALSRRTGLVKNANSTVLNGKPFKEDLQQVLAREVRLENDANCFAISEATDGAGQGLRSVFGVILGTGVGGGLVVDGRLVVGAAHIAGEWGHNPLPVIAQLGLKTDLARQLALAESPGPACYCGRWGCVETWLSGPAWVADYQRLCAQVGARAASCSTAIPDFGPGKAPGIWPGASPDTTADTTPDSTLNAAMLVQRMQQGDGIAVLAFDRYVDRLARSLAVVVNTVDPDAIVLGGGISQIQGLADRLAAAIRPYVFSDEVATRIVVNQHGDSSGVRGAAWLWND